MIRKGYILEDLLRLSCIHLVNRDERLDLGPFPLLHALPNRGGEVVDTGEDQRSIHSEDTDVALNHFELALLRLLVNVSFGVFGKEVPAGPGKGVGFFS